MTVDDFIGKWENCPGSERANYAVFLTELAAVLGVEAPGPSDDYRIDAPVPGGADGGGTGFIDLYKRGCFILEAKQSKVCEVPALAGSAQAPSDEGTSRYDELMRRAFRQARRYAVNLPPDHPWPPFIIVLDVGRAFELYFDYAGNGRDYRFFPDRASYRVPLRSLRDPAVRERLRAVWTTPKSLDPRLVTADVTRDVARRLASVSAWLEETQRLDASNRPRLVARPARPAAEPLRPRIGAARGEIRETASLFIGAPCNPLESACVGPFKSY